MRGFATMPKNQMGYKPQQVDSFFDRARDPHSGTSETDVRSIAFDLEPAGYDPEQVDRALDRLEESFSRRQRRRILQESGRRGLHRHITDLSDTLESRLERPDGEAFRNASDEGYAKTAVDAFLDRVEEYLETGAGLDLEEVRLVTFPVAREEQAYHEGVVDAYLDRIVEVMLART